MCLQNKVQHITVHTRSAVLNQVLFMCQVHNIHNKALLTVLQFYAIIIVKCDVHVLPNLIFLKSVY